MTYSSLSLPDAHVLGEVVAVHQRELRQEVLNLGVVPASSRQPAVREQRGNLFRIEAEGKRRRRAVRWEWCSFLVCRYAAGIPAYRVPAVS